jgi:hypothetical protein
MNEPKDDDRIILPRGFPPWPGVLAGLVVGGALAAADILGLFPAVPRGLAGRVMIAAHALVVLAIVTLLGQRARIAALRRELMVCCDLPDDQRTGWPVEAFRDTLKRLFKRNSSGDMRAGIDRTAVLLGKRQQGTWRLGLIIAYLVPAIGFALTLRGLQIQRGSVPWHHLALPLIMGVAESIPVLLLAVYVRKAVGEVVSEWQRFAGVLAIERRTRGARGETLLPTGDEEEPTTTLLPEDQRMETLLPRPAWKEAALPKGPKQEPTTPETVKKDPAPPRA